MDAKHMHSSKLRSLIAIVAIFAIGAFTILSFQNRVVYNASRKDVWLALPDDATRINIFQPGAFEPCTYFEFDTSEKSFLDWVGGHSNLKRSPHVGPFQIRRYYAYGPNADSKDIVTITNGYFFEWTEEDRGQRIAYDKDTGRAYYFSHSR